MAGFRGSRELVDREQAVGREPVDLERGVAPEPEEPARAVARAELVDQGRAEQGPAEQERADPAQRGPDLAAVIATAMAA